MVCGETKSGIKFSVDEKVKDDLRLTYMISEIQKNADDALKSMQSMGSLLGLLFQSEDNVLVFMNEVAIRHDGVCSAQAMIDELNEIFDAIKAKN